MHSILMIVHCSACVLLILTVLLQAGRGAGFAVFGGGGDTLFASPGGSDALKKSTMVLASTFAMTSLMLTLISSRPGLSSVTGKGVAIPMPQQTPAAPTSKPVESEEAPEEGAQAPMALPAAKE